MTPVIKQLVRLSCSPQKLFEMYMDSAKHSAATGQPAHISRRAGGAFTALGGMLRGRNLWIIPGRLVVQAWRSENFKRTDPDSILVLTFTKVATGSQVDLVHVNVPVQDHAGVRKGWPRYYWKPWKKYLAGQTAATR